MKREANQWLLSIFSCYILIFFLPASFLLHSRKKKWLKCDKSLSTPFFHTCLFSLYISFKKKFDNICLLTFTHGSANPNPNIKQRQGLLKAIKQDYSGETASLRLPHLMHTARY